MLPSFPGLFKTARIQPLGLWCVAFLKKVCKYTCYVALFLYASFLGLIYYFEHQPVLMSKDETLALTHLNQLRISAGANAVVALPTLMHAAKIQAEYTVEVGELQHVRKKHKGLFNLLETLGGRLNSSFYFSHGTESMGQSEGRNPDLSVNYLLKAPYHRIPLLDPGITQIGLGLLPYTEQNGNWLALVFEIGGYTESPSVVVWPASGTEVPCAFQPSDELPNPAPEAKDGLVGYIVTVEIASALNKELSTQHFSMVDNATQTEIKGRIASSSSDTHMPSNAVAFIPEKPLLSGHTYGVSFKGYAEDSPISKSWTFSARDGR